MATILQTQFLTEILDLDAEEIPLGKRSFFREQFKHRLHEVVLRKYLALKDSRPEFTKRVLARRIARSPEQVTRWLGAAGNLTLDTVSDLLLGMGAVPDVFVFDVSGLTPLRRDEHNLETMLKRQKRPQPGIGIPKPGSNAEQAHKGSQPRIHA